MGDYCKRWRIEVNIDKTKKINFCGNGHCCKSTSFYGEKLIGNAINYKYLGLVFNASGTWSNATNNLSTRGLKALFSLKKYICTGNIKARLGMNLSDQMIKPILCYASKIWSVCDLAKNKFRTVDEFAKYLDNIAIEKVHVKFCKFILGVNKRTVNLAIKGELGRFPVNFSCLIQAFKYWYHLQESSNSLLRKASFVCRDLHDKGVSSWFTFYDSICKSINVKADDPSATVMLQSLLCENSEYTGLILYRVSVN